MKLSKKRIAQIATLGVIVLLLLLYFVNPAFKNTMNTIFATLASADVDKVIEYIRSFGAWAVLVSFLLMILQAIIAPLPAFLITFANAAIFGWWQGAILSWTSAMVGAIICFYISRILGRDVVVKLTSNRALNEVDKFFDRYGKNTILICRLLPFVSFDLVSYAAGLTGMSFLGFIVATGIGQLPATIVYSYVGGMLTGGTQLFVTALLIIFALFALIVLIKSVYNDRQKKKEKAEATEE